MISMKKKHKFVDACNTFSVYINCNMPIILRHAFVQKRIKSSSISEKKARIMAEGTNIGNKGMPNRALYHAIINRFFSFKHSLAIIQRPPTSKGQQRNMCFQLKIFLLTILRSRPSFHR